MPTVKKTKATEEEVEVSFKWNWYVPARASLVVFTGGGGLV